MSDFKKSATAISCYAVILSMFLPWINIFGAKLSGLSIADFSQMPDGELLYFLYVIPLSAGAILYFGVSNYNKNVPYITIFRFIPLIVVIALTITSMNNMHIDFDDFLEVFSFGYFLSVIGSVALVATYFYEKKNVSASSIINPIAASRSVTKFCSNCGAQVTAEAMFCGECGQSAK